jgi:hypothetical protein
MPSDCCCGVVDRVGCHFCHLERAIPRDDPLGHHRGAVVVVEWATRLDRVVVGRHDGAEGEDLLHRLRDSHRSCLLRRDTVAMAVDHHGEVDIHRRNHYRRAMNAVVVEDMDFLVVVLEVHDDIHHRVVLVAAVGHRTLHETGLHKDLEDMMDTSFHRVVADRRDTRPSQLVRGRDKDRNRKAAKVDLFLVPWGMAEEAVV